MTEPVELPIRRVLRGRPVLAYPTTHLSVRVDTRIKEAFENLAQEHDCYPADMYRAALEGYLECAGVDWKADDD